MYYNQYKNLQNGMVFLILKYVEKKYKLCKFSTGFTKYQIQNPLCKKKKKKKHFGSFIHHGHNIGKTVIS